MITATVAETSVRFEFVLDEGEVAFVDADWLPAAGRTAVAAITISSGDDHQPVEIARGQLAATAGAAVAGLKNHDVDLASIHVPGRGAVADEVRRRLGLEVGPPTETPARPRVWIETSGAPEALETALAGVADLGTVVLTAPAREPTIAIDLYRDIHLRGLHLHAVGTEPTDAGEEHSSLPDPIPVTPGQTVPLRGWYWLHG
jgi:threonine dehydrogenase-like Zn-dependent dehydrogenase